MSEPAKKMTRAEQVEFYRDVRIGSRKEIWRLKKTDEMLAAAAEEYLGSANLRKHALCNLVRRLVADKIANYECVIRNYRVRKRAPDGPEARSR